MRTSLLAQESKATWRPLALTAGVLESLLPIPTVVETLTRLSPVSAVVPVAPVAGAAPSSTVAQPTVAASVF
ncbi:hypothetical protein AB0J86_09440 [Micromonospora sp. NPDC049559]|uniref:hypothetical protein n=1 Tax=Micromonospora sp. NPDC049559 TaxID=3155923 RepID=UPI00342C6D16